MNVRQCGNVRHAAWTHKDDNAALPKADRKPEAPNSAKAHAVAIARLVSIVSESKRKEKSRKKKKETR